VLIISKKNVTPYVFTLRDQEIHILNMYRFSDVLFLMKGRFDPYNLYSKNFVDSISTALCSYVQSDLMCYVCTTWRMFTRYEKAQN
jgi:hypothetical protein